MGKILINISQSFHYILIIQTIIRHGTERLWFRITWCMSSGLISLVSKNYLSPNLPLSQHRLQNFLLKGPGELLPPGWACRGWRGALHSSSLSKAQSREYVPERGIWTHKLMSFQPTEMERLCRKLLFIILCSGKPRVDQILSICFLDRECKTKDK